MEKTLAQDIMSTELLTIREGETLGQALKILVKNRITGLPVVNAENQMLGIVSEYDLIGQLSSHPNPNAEVFQEPIRFSRTAFSLPVTTPLAQIVEHMLSSKFRRVPVVDANGRLVGIITRRDLMRVYYYRARLT